MILPSHRGTIELMEYELSLGIPCVSDCVMAELEKLGPKYRLALRVARDPRFERLPCSHKGTYADDCIVQRITAHRCYIVATNDRALRRRVRKIPGVPVSLSRDGIKCSDIMC